MAPGWRVVMCIGAALGSAGCFDAATPLAPIACRTGADCPAALACFESRCVLVGAPCLTYDDEGREARAVADGNGCGDGRICLAGACNAIRCGDGIVSGDETCDGSPGCRPDCTACGDGVVNGDEECDDALANSDDLPGACRTRCLRAACGDGVRDPLEGCDDGLANNDGDADACRTSCVRAGCGDGVIDDGEACDDGARNSDVAADACRTSCAPPACGDGVIDDGEACDDGALNSEIRAGACRRDCRAARCGDGTVDLGEQCDDGALNSDTRPGACRATCVSAACGDSTVDPREECDDGAANSDALSDACRLSCVLPACGDGTIDDGEDCDDGGANADDLPGRCRRACALPRCGDGTVDADEACDEGTLNADDVADACRTTCALAACGDGVRDTGEACDDGARNDDDAPDACRTTCALPSCGDGAIDDGEACDDGPANADELPGRCRRACVLPRCGDGTVDADEDCDDGPLNADVADACRVDCALPSCGDGIRDADEACDDGDGNADDVADACRVDCALPSCGDGTIDPGELCDDGTRNSDRRPAACRGDCRPARCGDGVTDPGEGCDDGAFNSDVLADVCRTGCALPACGDGVSDTGEACDDGDRVGGDGCSAGCDKVEACGDTVVDDGEDCDDGNANPRDGCDACRAQRFVARVVVNGDVEAATLAAAGLSGLQDIGRDGQGRLLLVDGVGRRLLRVGDDGVLQTLAGVGVVGAFVPGGRATSAALDGPRSVAVDARGRIFLADVNLRRVLRLADDGTLPVVAGNGRFIADLDNADASGVGVPGPFGIDADALGRVYIADRSDHRIRRLNLDGSIVTLAGATTAPTVQAGFVDGARGTSRLNRPNRIAVEDVCPLVAGERTCPVVVADLGNNAIRRLDTDGVLTTIAGDGTAGFLGDDGPARSARLRAPADVALDGAGGVWIADTGNHRVRHIGADGIIRTVAGNGLVALDGDGPATQRSLASPLALLSDGDGVLIVDSGHGLLRRLGADGQLVTVGGTGQRPFAGDGRDALETELGRPEGVTFDAAGRLVFSEGEVPVIRRVEADGRITRIAGSTVISGGNIGDGGPATAADLSLPRRLATLPDGSIVFTDDTVDTTGLGRRVRRVRPDGVLETLAGNGAQALTCAEQQGPGATIALGRPFDLAVTPDGDVVFDDVDGDCVFRLAVSTGEVTLLGVLPDPGNIGGLAVRADGVVLVSDFTRNQILTLDAAGAFAVLAGTGASGDGGDGGPAAQATFTTPTDLVIERGADGLDRRLFVLEANGSIPRRLRVIDLLDPARTIRGFAGGAAANAGPGDGGPATGAELSGPLGVAQAPDGSVVVADGTGRVIRRVGPDGTITTVVGRIHPATSAALPSGSVIDVRSLALDDAGGVFVATGRAGRLLSLDLDPDLRSGRVVRVAGYDALRLATELVVDRAALQAFVELTGVASATVAGTRTLWLADASGGRVFRVDAPVAADPASFTIAPLALATRAPADLAILEEGGARRLVVVDRAAHCLRSFDIDADPDGVAASTLAGRCDLAGVSDGPAVDARFDGPTHVLVAADGALYVSDTDNHRVVRAVRDAAGTLVVTTILGTGVASSFGDGAPAATLSVARPGPLALDDAGNLWVGSADVLRVVTDRDDDGVATGGDAVRTVDPGLRGGNGTCIEALVQRGATLLVGDACNGRVLGVESTLVPLPGGPP